MNTQIKPAVHHPSITDRVRHLRSIDSYALDYEIAEYKNKLLKLQAASLRNSQKVKQMELLVVSMIVLFFVIWLVTVTHLN